ncbi:MAG: ferredoxin--NADP reductase [Halobacterium sp.]
MPEDREEANAERAAALPLVTESARVAELTALDHNRTDELREEAVRVLDDLGRSDLVTARDPPSVDWPGVREYAAEDAPADGRLDALARRWERPYPSLLSVELALEDRASFSFVPGQYVALTFHDTPRPYSLASSPNDDRLRVCVRRVPGGHLTPELFETMAPGDEVTVRGPSGDFVLDEPSTRDVAFLATGTGVAPFRSMIDYLFEAGLDSRDGEPRDVWLFLGAAWRDDLAYREHFADLAAARDNFHFVPTLSRERYLTDWDGETAYVQDVFAKHLDDEAAPPDFDAGGSPATDVDARIDPGNVDVYACGISAMVDTLVDTARAAGVPAERVHGEGYG